MSYTIWPDGSTGEILQDIYRERFRQEELRLKGKFEYTCDSKEISNSYKLAILGEEFGEVSKEVNEELNFLHKLAKDPCEVDHIKKAYHIRMRKELIQVAAVCVAWAESLEEK